MKCFRFLLIFCLPAFLLSPIPSFSQEKKEIRKTIFIPRDVFGKVSPWELFRVKNLSIDSYFDFIDLIENEAFLETLTEEEFDNVVDFVTWIVRYSVPNHDPDLKERMEWEVEELLSLLYEEEEPHFSVNHNTGFEIIPAVDYGNARVVFCKGWFSRKWHHLGHWVGKHKRPLIVGAVVVGAVTIAVITGGVGASSAVAVGGALVDATTNEDLPNAPPQVNKPGEVVFLEDNPPSSPPSSSVMAQSQLAPPHLEDVFETVLQQAEIARVLLSTELPDEPLNISEKTFWEEVKEETRETISYIVHATYETVAEIGEYWHKLNPSTEPDTLVAYREQVAAEHEIIDEIFGTHQADNYTLEARENDSAIKQALADSGISMDMQVGVLPPPGSLATLTGRAISAARSAGVVGAATIGKAITQPSSPATLTDDFSIAHLTEEGKVPDRGGLTIAGRALAKHGVRPDSGFPKATGTPAQINEQGQKILEEILNSPDKEITQKYDKRLGDVIDIKVSDGDGIGVRFKANGEMVGFLESKS